MRCFVFVMLMAGVMMVVAPAVDATPITFQASLAGSNENPANGSPGTGFATVVLDPLLQTLQVNVTFSGLTANDTAAHIHCCLPSPFAPGNVGVATTMPAFPGFPLNVTSGTYMSAVFDLTQPTIYNPAFVTLEGGTISGAEAALIGGIENGETYLNIHTANFPGGEIRGFLVTPEPSSLVLLGSGLVGLLVVRRRKPGRPD